MCFLFTTLLFLGSLNRVESAAPSPPANEFILPGGAGDNDYTENPSWSHGSIQTIEWASNFTVWSLYLFHEDGIFDEDPQRLTSGFNTVTGQQESSFTWNISLVVADYADYPVFFLGLDGGDAGGFNSPYFNITSQASTTPNTLAPDTSTSITAASTTTATTTTSPLVSSATPPGMTPVEANANAAKSGSGLSEGAKAAVGITAAIIGLALIAGAVYAAFVIGKKSSWPGAPPPYAGIVPKAENNQYAQPAAIHGYSQSFEIMTGYPPPPLRPELSA